MVFSPDDRSALADYWGTGAGDFDQEARPGVRRFRTVLMRKCHCVINAPQGSQGCLGNGRNTLILRY
jgi:hypothetical protein